MSVAFDQSESRGDAELMALYARGDQSAARQLTGRHLPRVLAHAYRLLQDRAEAEDVAQEAMLKLWKIAPDWREGEARLSTWLYRVTANACTDRLRKRRTTGLEAASEQIDDTPGVVEKMIIGDRQRALHQAIGSLPERQRNALTLRHFEALSNPEIAETLETSVEAVESLLGRARRTLSEKLSHLRPRKTGSQPKKGAMP